MIVDGVNLDPEEFSHSLLCQEYCFILNNGLYCT